MGEWEHAEAGDACSECGDTLEVGQDIYVHHSDLFCEGCHEDMMDNNWDDDDYDYYDSNDYCDPPETSLANYIDGVGFADPGGKSALRAATRDNPRNLPCRSCHRENVLTPLDVQAGYVCDTCADQAENGW